MLSRTDCVVVGVVWSRAEVKVFRHKVSDIYRWRGCLQRRGRSSSCNTITQQQKQISPKYLAGPSSKMARSSKLYVQSYRSSKLQVFRQLLLTKLMFVSLCMTTKFCSILLLTTSSISPQMLVHSSKQKFTVLQYVTKLIHCFSCAQLDFADFMLKTNKFNVSSNVVPFINIRKLALLR